MNHQAIKIIFFQQGFKKWLEFSMRHRHLTLNSCRSYENSSLYTLIKRNRWLGKGVTLREPFLKTRWAKWLNHPQETSLAEKKNVFCRVNELNCSMEGPIPAPAQGKSRTTPGGILLWGAVICWNDLASCGNTAQEWWSWKPSPIIWEEQWHCPVTHCPPSPVLFTFKWPTSDRGRGTHPTTCSTLGFSIETDHQSCERLLRGEVWGSAEDNWILGLPTILDKALSYHCLFTLEVADL